MPVADTTAQQNKSTGASLVPRVVFTKPLYMGLRGDDVLILQRVLYEEALLPMDAITGYYGPLTTKAVQQLQVRYDIVTEGTIETTGFGLVGGKTRSVLNDRVQKGAYKTVGVSSVSLVQATTLSSEKIALIQKQIAELTILVNELVKQLAEVLKAKSN